MSPWKAAQVGPGRVPLAEAGALVLLCLLSWQVVSVKRANATLRGEIERKIA